VVGERRGGLRHNGADRDQGAGAAMRIPGFSCTVARGMKAAKKSWPRNLRITKASKTPTESAT
jgi:hypothetical protein